MPSFTVSIFTVVAILTGFQKPDLVSCPMKEYYKTKSGLYLVATFVKKFGGYRVAVMTPAGDVPISRRRQLDPGAGLRPVVKYFKREQLGKKLKNRPRKDAVRKAGW